MSSSHTETITVQSYWTKGLVRNTVTSTDYYNIQDAIDNSSAADTLHIWAWTYYENIEIDESISLIGNGTANTTINGTWNRIVTISSDDVTLKNLKLVSNYLPNMCNLKLAPERRSAMRFNSCTTIE